MPYRGTATAVAPWAAPAFAVPAGTTAGTEDLDWGTAVDAPGSFGSGAGAGAVPTAADGLEVGGTAAAGGFTLAAGATVGCVADGRGAVVGAALGAT